MEKEKIICHDCKKELKKGDEYMKYKNKDFYKCKACHEEDSVLRDFEPCKVYARIVGFYSDTDKWNKGKSEEWKDRKTYKLDKS